MLVSSFLHLAKGSFGQLKTQLAIYPFGHIARITDGSQYPFFGLAKWPIEKICFTWPTVHLAKWDGYESLLSEWKKRSLRELKLGNKKPALTRWFLKAPEPG